jgi:hypothetical protein
MIYQTPLLRSRGWVDRTINHLNTTFAENNVRSEKPLSLEMQNIDCAGHYVADCQVCVILRGDNYGNDFTGATRNGYLSMSAIDKADKSVVTKMVTDAGPRSYLPEK